MNFSEILDWKEFEQLAVTFFEKVYLSENNSQHNFVEPSGTGSDGGRDLLVTITVHDSFITFKRKWVVQCKFYEDDLNKSNLSDINIPSLIEEYGADGYLLICKNGVTGPVSKQFESFRRNCRSGKHYLIWTGSQFLDKLIEHRDIIERYFPKYYKKMFVDSNDKSSYEEYIKEFQKKEVSK